MEKIFKTSGHGLTKRAKLTFQIDYAFFTLVAVVLVSGVSIFFGLHWLIILAITLVIILIGAFFSLVLASFEYKNYFYDFDKLGVIVECGVLFKKREFIPYGIIQDVTLEKGPILRKLQLMDVIIRGVNNTLVISSLEEKVAESIKKYILEERSKHRIEY